MSERNALAGERRAQPNGWWGMVLFLCAESTLFGGLIATYFYLNFSAPKWPPAGIPPPDTLAPLVLTGALLATSVPLGLAARSARAGRLRPAIWLIALAVLVQCGYLSYQLHLLVHELHQFPPQQSAYASIYFTLLGLHHAHVALGILIGAGVLLFLLVDGLTDYRLTGVRVLALYWYVVNALAVLVVITQLWPSL